MNEWKKGAGENVTLFAFNIRNFANSLYAEIRSCGAE